MKKSKNPGRPFLKWLGGKTKMIPHILDEMPESCKTYYEPFLGGGSVFIEMAKSGKFKNAVIGDMNEELVNTWLQVKDHPTSLIKELENGYYIYNKKRYLEIRELETKSLTKITRAARFVYLNKTCFNGLYRVNQSGKFNVPFGKYTDPQIVDEENLHIISSLLKNVTIIHGDFELVVKDAKKGDLVYIDPPYIPLSSTSKFSQYTSGGFSEPDHWRLAGLFNNLVHREVDTILSNSSAPLSLKLYGDHEIITLNGTRSVAGPGDWRKSVSEIMVVAKRRKKTKTIDEKHASC
jgi:DNA adenine methylase